MFQWAAEHGGRAFAVTQTPDEFREAATDVTTSVGAGGVATGALDPGRRGVGG
jgi:hypothetical protein